MRTARWTLLVALMMTATPPAAAEGKSAAVDGALTASEVQRQIVGHSVALEDGAMTWYYRSGGRYDADDGRNARGGTYVVRSDGRLCWEDNTGVSGCFQYYRRNGQLRARRADPDNTFEVGVVKPGPL